MLKPTALLRATTALSAEYFCATVLVLTGCGSSRHSSDSGVTESETAAESGTGGSGSGGEVGIIVGVAMGGSLESCAAEADPPLFSGQQFDVAKPVARVIYSWTTAEQEAELRAGDALLLTGEMPGVGRGYAMDVVHELAAPEVLEAPAITPEPDALAQAILTVFTKYRYGWTNPWATRVGWPGESYGNRLIRIELRDEAWVATLRGSWLGDVYDLAGNVVPREDALAHPERIALIFHEHIGVEGAPYCGTFASGGNGYREFVIGNEAMIKEWSLGTDVILARLESDIAELERFLSLSRRCAPFTSTSGGFNASVACGWGGGYFGDLPADYANTLALPSDSYVPTPRNLVTLIEALEGDLFEPDPRVVTPGSN